MHKGRANRVGRRLDLRTEPMVSEFHAELGILHGGGGFGGNFVFGGDAVAEDG